MFKIREGSYTRYEDEINPTAYIDGIKKITNKKITYLNDVIAFDIETSSFKDFDEEASLYQDIEVYNHIKGVKIKISDSIYKEFPDFNLIRRELFGRIYFSKIDGISIDSFYHELSTEYPYYFNEDIINPYDQLMEIIQVFNDNSPEKIERDDKRALMYVWQIAINGHVIIGRTWEQFVDLINKLSSGLNLSQEKRLIIWVHNLAFEFQFLKDYFTWNKVFAISTRKPIYALTDSGIEFRCSYILSNLSLANIGESLKKYKVSKLVGSLDYELVRHQETPLTDEEINYCINDVLVLSCYIKELIEENSNNITLLPLTATGFCRNFTRKMCLGTQNPQQFHKYHKGISRLKCESLEEFDQWKRAFMGGFTHTSARHSGKVLHDVDSFDLTSAYPFALCAFNEFPMSKGTKIKITNYKEFEKYLKLYFCIFDIKFINLKPIYINENYISISKCFSEDGKRFTKKQIKEYNIVTNNGRLVGSDVPICTTICNIDFDIIKRVYKWDRIEIGTFRYYRRGYIPREIIMSILTLYQQKTTLKGVECMEDFYTKSKQLLNSIYGMMVTSPIMPLHEYDNTKGWTINHKDAEEQLKKYNRSKKRFNWFPWGIACTALIRRVVFSGILAFSDDYYYSDTDSLKVINANKHMDYINKYNAFVERKLHAVSKYYKIPFEMFAPKTIKGEIKMLGVWDKETEQPYKNFLSIGAKRYLILTHDDKLKLTVSGVNKHEAVPYLIQKYGKEGAFDHFNEQLTIPPEHTGKLTHYYLDSPYSGEVCDYLGNTINYNCRSGIYLEKTSYSFSMEAGYINYLKKLRGEIL